MWWRLHLAEVSHQRQPSGHGRLNDTWGQGTHGTFGWLWILCEMIHCCIRNQGMLLLYGWLWPVCTLGSETRHQSNVMVS